MIKLFLRILKDQCGATLSVTYSFSPNTLIASSQMNQNFTDVEAVCNAIAADNIANDAVTKDHINADVLRSNYGLAQHTDGTLYIDLHATPGLEFDGGKLRIDAYGILSLTANGIIWGRSGDCVLSSSGTTPDGFTDVSATYADKFIRISTTALSTGGSDNHDHGGATASYTLLEADIPSHRHTVTFYNRNYEAGPWPYRSAGSGGGDVKYSSFTGGGGGHAHDISSADNIPAFVTLKMYQVS